MGLDVGTKRIGIALSDFVETEAISSNIDDVNKILLYAYDALTVFVPVIVSASSLTDLAKKIVLNTVEDIEMHIDGNKYGETVIERGYEESPLFTIDEARLWWKERVGTDWAYNTIFFEVPANDTSHDRLVEVMVSINDSFYYVSDEWGDWFSVFKEVQKGR